MKNFKHKTTGDVATEQKDGNYLVNTLTLPSVYVEGSLDWIEQKLDYKILTQTISESEEPKKYIVHSGHANAFVATSMPLDIHSVKRLSDGKVFTVGDNIKVVYTSSLTDNRTYKINKFSKICLEEYDSLYVSGGSLSSIFYNIALKDIEKVELLFASEDGVDIFEGDVWWYVVHSKMVARKTNTLAYHGKSFSEVSKFSTQEEAEKWILSRTKYNFVTNDNVKIFPKSKYFAVNLKQNTLWSNICNSGTIRNKGVEYFSTRELAREFYIAYASVLSLFDIGKVYSTAISKSFYQGEIKYTKQGMQIRRAILSKLTEHKDN
jgi:hypothetical protein